MTILHFDVVDEIIGSIVVCMIYLVIWMNIILIVVLHLVGDVARRCEVSANSKRMPIRQWVSFNWLEKNWRPLTWGYLCRDCRSMTLLCRWLMDYCCWYYYYYLNHCWWCHWRSLGNHSDKTWSIEWQMFERDYLMLVLSHFARWKMWWTLVIGFFSGERKKQLVSNCLLPRNQIHLPFPQIVCTWAWTVNFDCSPRVRDTIEVCDRLQRPFDLPAQASEFLHQNRNGRMFQEDEPRTISIQTHFDAFVSMTSLHSNSVRWLLRKIRRLNCIHGELSMQKPSCWFESIKMSIRLWPVRVCGNLLV